MQKGLADTPTPYGSSFKQIEKIRLGAKALIVHDHKILVIREKVDGPHGREEIYDFPGGGIEPGESVISGLKREVFEEIGLEIEAQRLLGTWDFIVPRQDNYDIGVHVVCLGYQCRPTNGIKVDLDNNPAQEDIFDTQWLTKSQILGLDQSIFNLEAVLASVNKLDLDHEPTTK